MRDLDLSPFVLTTSQRTKIRVPGTSSPKRARYWVRKLTLERGVSGLPRARSRKNRSGGRLVPLETPLDAKILIAVDVELRGGVKSTLMLAAIAGLR